MFGVLSFRWVTTRTSFSLKQTHQVESLPGWDSGAWFYTILANGRDCLGGRMVVGFSWFCINVVKLIPNGFFMLWWLLWHFTSHLSKLCQIFRLLTRTSWFHSMVGDWDKGKTWKKKDFRRIGWRICIIFGFEDHFNQGCWCSISSRYK